MLEQLTIEQKAMVESTRDRFFAAATSTVTDRAKAEAAARVIVAPALKEYEIHWCTTLDEASSLWDSLWDSLRYSLRDSLRYSLRDSLRYSLRDSLRDSLWDSLRYSLRYSLWGSLSVSLWGSLSVSLSASLRYSLWDSLRYSLRYSLWGSLSVSLWDSEWICFYSGCGQLVDYKPEDKARLQAYVDLAESAFAIWVLPGHVILLEKPKKADVRDGKLVGLEW
jgi:hypothetical protein